MNSIRETSYNQIWRKLSHAGDRMLLYMGNTFLHRHFWYVSVARYVNVYTYAVFVKKKNMFESTVYQACDNAIGINSSTLDNKPMILTPAPTPDQSGHHTRTQVWKKHPFFADFGQKNTLFNRNRWFWGPIKDPLVNQTLFFRNISWSTIFVKVRIYVTTPKSRHFSMHERRFYSYF